MSRDDSAEDLLVRARERALAEGEERRLQIALRSSRELELLFDAGVHFDEQARVAPGDDTRSSRLVASTLARLDRARVPELRAAQLPAPSALGGAHAAMAARYFAASLGFGLLFSVALASAWDYVEHPSSHARSAEAAPSPVAQPKGAAAPRRAVPVVFAAPSAEPVSSAPAVESPGVQAKAASSPPSAAALVPEAQPAALALSSSELFAAANQARREGDIEAAIALYERLGREQPASVEAQDAKVLVGNLLLSQRSPRAALRQFEDYGSGAAGASGALKLEALWGRARALRKLGSPDEKAILVQLALGYPGTAYAEAAQKRLNELSP